MDTAPRAPVAGPTFIRLLARITGDAAPASGIAPSERLGRWIDWHRAVALSRALDRPLERSADAAPAQVGGESPDAEVERVRQALHARINAREGWDKAMPDAASDANADAGDGFAGLRKHCTTLQHAIQAATGRLRGNLRERLAAGTPAQARLAELDAVMELVASPREQQLLAAVPGLLAGRFAPPHPQADTRAGDDLLAAVTAVPATEPRRHAIRTDLQDLLQAELELRFMPIDGLLAALHSD